MDTLSLTIGLSWVLSSLFIIAMAIPLVLGRVPQYGFYGVRLPASFKSDAAWLAINHQGGRELIGWSIPMFLAGVGALVVPLDRHPAATWVLAITPLVFLLVATVRIVRFASRL